MAERFNNQSSDDEKLKSEGLEEKILQRAAGLKVPQGLSKEEALMKLKRRISDGSTVIKRESNFQRTLFVYSSIAAGLLLLFGIWRIWIYNPLTEVVVANSYHTDYKLPDGSLVKINSGSKISFDKKDFMLDRRLNLEGEAYFEITKGDNFIISTKQADIKILGTTLNVLSRNDEFKVSCLTGKILVSDKSTSVTIEPGESAILKGSRLINYQDKNINMSNSWVTGEFYFENASLNLVFKEMERQFNVNFEFRNIDDKYFTGSFSNNNLDNALEIVCKPMGLKYEIGSNDKIIISEKKP